MRAINTFTALSLAILTGCSAQPKALYQPVPVHDTALGDGKRYEGDWEGLPKFTLAKSQLVVDYKDKEKRASPQMISVPTEAQRGDADQTRFMLRQDDGFGIDTHLKVTKLDNTDMLSSVGTEVEDKRVKYIESAGALVVKAMAIASVGKGAVLPISIDSSKMLRDTGIEREGGTAYAVARSPASAIHLQATFGPVEDDALDNSVFARTASIKAQETIIHSACRSVTVLFDDGPLAGQQFSATVADPRYIETVKLPEKGTVDFHTACGANTTSAASGASTTLDLVNAVIAQSKAVRDAWKTEKSTKEQSKIAMENAVVLTKAKGVVQPQVAPAEAPAGE